ncbi:hypothetical protein [Actinobacillus pleuropneumoniae]|uniref:Uncharacterized protein n=1 Tax=Actinobacillus pleuropneumoniae TaxID=715 RepID=A0A9Q4DJ07_ACTPL|nr:hypothetical protein [Actinobacillus pleuropneumoniae]MCL7721146.1 hypothetical protein [Actinobacillus pleuropneumoniae]MCL7727162.1 hypothetical protein [Actinobacillus pleuropneumoniae]MCL7730269.1 hypothetical protein [Actinobacillus pleuropneumoniae]MCY6368663.1 hypothetical protein [Actinobacillus pleuropneumoniae]MCY6385534.1 hypothetical protein [Actinobacillus pleuropneumoniae]
MLQPQYIVNNQHRNQNPNKSQWCIRVPEERDLFVSSFNSCWFHPDNQWCFGIIPNNKKPTILGISASNDPLPQQELHFAKFVCDQNVWHGYPFGRASSDLNQIPKSVLDSWKKEGYISNAVRSKIHKGRYPL